MYALSFLTLRDTVSYTGAVCLSVFGISNADEGPFYGTGSRRKKSAVTK